MSLKTAYLAISGDNEWSLHVPASQYLKSTNKTIGLKVGAEGRTQKVLLSHENPSTNSISSKIKIISKDGAVHAGPLLGILTVRRGNDFKGNKANFVDIIHTAKRLGAIVFVFCVEDIQWNNHTTGAFFYQETTSKWVYLPNIPLPHIVYNRVPYREDEEKGFVQDALNRLQKINGLHLYNPHFFNKWNLYQILSDNPKVAGYVPASLYLKDHRQLENLAEHYPLLYLKPISGKAGAGIMNIVCKNGTFILNTRSKNNVVSRSFANLRSLFQSQATQFRSGYVVQQGIHLLRYNDRPFDIRVLVQKDGLGEWKVSGIGIRVAGKNSITTHVPRGGSIASPEEVLLPLLGKEKFNEKMLEIQRMALEIATALDQHYSKLGEMSMDIGLTREGKLWFFEANAKPMKFDEPHIRKTSLERIIQYAQYLSNFTEKGEAKDASQADYSRTSP